MEIKTRYLRELPQIIRDLEIHILTQTDKIGQAKKKLQEIKKKIESQVLEDSKKEEYKVLLSSADKRTTEVNNRLEETEYTKLEEQLEKIRYNTEVLKIELNYQKHLFWGTYGLVFSMGLPK